MKIKGPINQDQAPRGTRGAYAIRVTKNGLVATKWPDRRPVVDTGSGLYQQQEMTWAGIQSTDPWEMDLLSAIAMAIGIQYLPRDILTMAMYGLLYEIGFFEGVYWRSWRTEMNNGQFLLDLIGSVNGAMLRKDPIGWVILLPGETGDSLTMIDGYPNWVPQQNPLPAPYITVEPYAALPEARVLETDATIGVSLLVDGRIKLFRELVIGDIAIPYDSNTATIQPAVVTYAKIQDVTATSRLLGRKTVGSGSVEELTPADARTIIGSTPGGSSYSPYLNDATIYITPQTVAGAALTTVAPGANVITFVPIIVSVDRTLTSIALSIPAGGNVAGSNARLAIYNRKETTGGPGTLVLDAGNVTTATTGVRSITINQAIVPGQYFLAIWPSAAITIRALTAGFSFANVGWSLGAATPAGYGGLTRAVAFGSAYGDESGNTHTLALNSTAMPLLGVR